MDERILISALTHPLDAVQLFDKTPEGTFFYMQRVGQLLKQREKLSSAEYDMISGCEEFDLFVCSHDMYDIKDYYTLSRKGVTHIAEGQHSFTPMSEWLDELQKL